MSFCEQCGSASRDKDGFCGGCGAPWPLPEVLTQPVPASSRHDSANHASGASAALPIQQLAESYKAFGSSVALSKQMGVALLLAFFFGPFGLFYSTATGAIVMCVVGLVLRLFLGPIAPLIVIPICVFWAWRAAREQAI